MVVPQPAASAIPPQPSHVRHGVLGLTLALTAVAYLDRVCIATAAPAMKADLQLSDAQMGYVFSAFTLAYALFEVPSGWLADRFGPRLMLTRIVIWWSAMTAATGCVGGFASLVAVRFLFGVGEAGTLPEHGTRVRALAAGGGTWPRLRTGADDRRARRRGDAAAGGGAARPGALAAHVPDLRSWSA